jgi:hypothetical protein
MSLFHVRATFAAFCCLIAAPAAAQLGSGKMISTPAEKYAVAPGGVDMRTGQYTYRQTDLSIGGTDESGGLTLIRTSMVPWHGVSPFANFSHNWDILLTEKRVSLGTGDYTNFSGQDYQISVRFAGRSQVFNSNPSQTAFQLASNGPYASLAFSGTLASAGVIYTFTATDGTVATFRPLGNLDCLAGNVARCTYVSQIVETDGTTFTFDYDYNASAPSGVERARLRSVVSSRGYALLLEGANGLVSKACVLNLTQMVVPANHLCPANAAATATYSYVPNSTPARLASVTDGANATWSFTYGAGTGGTTTMGFIKPGQFTPWLTNSIFSTADEDNGGYEAVASQSFVDGQSYTYTYDHTPLVFSRTPNQTIAGGTYTDALGHQTIVRYDFPEMPGSKLCHDRNHCPWFNFDTDTVAYQLTSGPIQVTDPINHTTTSDYCDPNAAALPPPDGGCLVTLVQSFTDPEGIKTDLTYDGMRNVTRVRRHPKPGSTGVSDIVTSAVYDSQPKSSNKPVVAIDANQNETDFKYDPAHGGVVWEKDPPPTPGGIRPEKRYSYAARTAWISNGAGGWVAAGAPVYVLTQMSFCKSGPANSTDTGCANAGDEVTTTYDYGPDSGPNNLILRGTVVDAGGLSLRTCYAYDALGNKISETRPRAGLTGCP